MASNLSIALMIGASVGSAIAGIKRLQGVLTTLRDSTTTNATKLASLGKMTALGLSGAISGVKATSGAMLNLAGPAIAFESAMADVKKVVDFKTPEGFANLSKDLLGLTRQLPMTKEELAAIAASGGQLGVAEEDLKSFTTTIAKMSVAFDMSADASGDAMAKLANVYKIPIKDIGNLGDAINELSNSSPAKASDIVNTLGRIGGVAKQFGLTEQGAAALSNSFISLGKTPEVAGTAINGMLTKLMTADKGGKKFQTTLKAMGLNATSLKKAIATDAEGAITDFLKRVNKLPKDQQMGALVDLFGREYADDVAVLAGNVDVLTGSLKTLQDTDANGKPKYLGSMEKEFNARAATTENGLQLLKNASEEFWTVIGARLLPAINSIAGGIANAIHGITDFASKNIWLVDTLLYLVGGVAGVVTGFSALTGAVGFSGVVWLSLAKPIAKTMGELGVFKKFIGKLGIGKLFWDIVGKISFGFGTLIGYIIKGATAFGKAILMMSRVLLTNPIALTIAVIAGLAYLIYDNWERIGPWFTELWQAVSGAFATAWNSITNFCSEAWTNISNFFTSGIGNITATILDWSPLGLFQQIFSAVLSWFGIDVPAKFSEFGKNMIDGLINGIKNAWEGAKQIVSDLGTGIKNWFAEKLNIHSPSRVFKGYGVNIVEGLAIGMDSTLPVAKTASDNLANALHEPEITPLQNYQPLNRAAITSPPQAQAQGLVVNFNPTINVNGGDKNGILSQVQQGLKMSLSEFETMLNRVLDQQRRRAY